MALLVLTSIAPLAREAEGTCTTAGQAAGTCASSDGHTVTIRGSETQPGAGSRGARAGGRSATNPKPGLTTAVRACGTLRVKCTNPIGNPAIGQRDGVTGSGPVRITDLIGFSPTPGIDHMEPGGWSVVGLDTNFFASASHDIQTGSLLGKPASVRFAPTAFHWTYGDGTAATLPTGGATWAELGLSPFDPTPTSHRYRERGTYSIDLTIEFGAEYRYTGDWIPVAGTISVPANRLTTTVGTAKTVLVERDCVQDPRGPGC